ERRRQGRRGGGGGERVHERAKGGRARPRHELGGRVGDGGLRAAPVEVLEEGHEEHRVGMHEAGADGERRKGATQERNAPATAGGGGRRGAHLTTWLPAAPPCPQARGSGSRRQASGA